MNPNTPRPGHLFFTPRTPWGTRAGQQSFRQHQRASEDEPKQPNLVQKLGNTVGHALGGLRPFIGADAEKVGSEHPSGSLVIGFQKGAKGPVSAASDDESKENRIRAENQSWGMKVPADEPESAHQESTGHVTTDQELAAGQKDWARRNPEWVNEKAKAASARFQASQARTKG